MLRYHAGVQATQPSAQGVGWRTSPCNGRSGESGAALRSANQSSRVLGRRPAAGGHGAGCAPRHGRVWKCVGSTRAAACVHGLQGTHGCRRVCLRSLPDVRLPQYGRDHPHAVRDASHGVSSCQGHGRHADGPRAGNEEAGAFPARTAHKNFYMRLGFRPTTNIHSLEWTADRKRDRSVSSDDGDSDGLLPRGKQHVRMAWLDTAFSDDDDDTELSEDLDTSRSPLQSPRSPPV